MAVTTDVPAPTDRECIAAELADVLAARLAMARQERAPRRGGELI
jgi:hypothetical protein